MLSGASTLLLSIPSPGSPIAFEIGPFPLRWYAIFILAGIFIGLSIVGRVALRRGMEPDFVADVAPWVLGSAILGARAYFVALEWRYFVDHPDEIIGLQLRGLTIHGALAGGIVAFAVICRRRGEPFFRWADTIVVGIPIGQAIGRWGNWANQEAFGDPSSLPWAVEIEPVRRPDQFADEPTFHPTFLYESLLSVVIAAVLAAAVLRLRARPWYRDGMAIGLYLILYGLARLPIERLRTDSLYIGSYPAAYWLSGALILAGASLIIIRSKASPA